MRANIRRIAIPAKHDRINRSHSQVNVQLGEGHEIFRFDVKLINAKVLKYSSLLAAFLREVFAKKKNKWGPFDPPPMRSRVNRLAADTYQNDALSLT